MADGTREAWEAALDDVERVTYQTVRPLPEVSPELASRIEALPSLARRSLSLVLACSLDARRRSADFVHATIAQPEPRAALAEAFDAGKGEVVLEAFVDLANRLHGVSNTPGYDVAVTILRASLLEDSGLAERALRSIVGGLSADRVPAALEAAWRLLDAEVDRAENAGRRWVKNPPAYFAESVRREAERATWRIAADDAREVIEHPDLPIDTPVTMRSVSESDAPERLRVARAISGDPRFTQREREILHLLALGEVAGESEAAERLGITRSTLRVHLANARRKISTTP